MYHLVTDRPLLFIAHNSADIVHWNEVNLNQNISTAQPNLVPKSAFISCLAPIADTNKS